MITPARKRQLEKLAESQFLNEVKRNNLREKRKLREQQIRETYNEKKDELYFNFIQQQHLTEWKGNGHALDGKCIGGHYYNVPAIKPNHPLFESIKVLRDEKPGKQKLQETSSYKDIIKRDEIRDPASGALQECIDLAVNGITMETEGVL